MIVGLRPGRRQRRRGQQDRHLRAGDRRPPSRRAVLRRRTVLDARRRRRATGARDRDRAARRGRGARGGRPRREDRGLEPCLRRDPRRAHHRPDHRRGRAARAVRSRDRGSRFEGGGLPRRRRGPDRGAAGAAPGPRRGAGRDARVRHLRLATSWTGTSTRRRRRCSGTSRRAWSSSRGAPGCRRRARASSSITTSRAGTASYCRRGRETLCAQFKATRIEPGGFSELILVPALNAALDLLPLPDTVSDEAATLIEPLACVVRGLDRARVAAETRLLVIGGGQMGLLIAQAALARGADGDRRGAAARAARAGGRARRPRRRRPTSAAPAPPTSSCSPPARPRPGTSPSPRPTRARVIQWFAPGKPGAAGGVRRQRAVLQGARDPGHATRPARATPAPRSTLIAAGAVATEPADHAPLPARGDRRRAGDGPQPRGHQGHHHRDVKAARLHGPGDLRIDDIPEPVAGPGRGRAARSAPPRAATPTSRASCAAIPRSARTPRGSGTSSRARSRASGRA